MPRRDENVPMPAQRKEVVELVLEGFTIRIVEEKQPLIFSGLQPLQSIVCCTAYTLGQSNRLEACNSGSLGASIDEKYFREPEETV